MDFVDEVQKAYCWISHIGSLGLKVLWHFLHFIVSTWYLALKAAHVLESCLISSGLLKRYKALNFGNLRYLAIVIESEEAVQIPKVIELLNWLATIGVKHVCLYDNEGVLKKSKEAILEKLNDATLFEGLDENNSLLDQEHITLEFASLSDGKEGLTKAANLLFMKYLKSADSSGSQEEPIFTEPHMTEALRAVGFRGPDPDLLLIYGPARCHLGFPAWRIRYTEIVLIPANEGQKELCVGETSEQCVPCSLVHRPKRVQRSQQISIKQPDWTPCEAYGAIEVHEIRLFNKSHLQVLNGAPKLWCIK